MIQLCNCKEKLGADQSGYPLIFHKHSYISKQTGDKKIEKYQEGEIVGFPFVKEPNYFFSCFLLFHNRFCATGPLIHYFYEALDKLVPRQVSYAKAKRLFVDRGIFSPVFLLVFFYVVAILEVSLFCSYVV